MTNYAFSKYPIFTYILYDQTYSKSEKKLSIKPKHMNYTHSVEEKKNTFEFIADI